MSNKTVSAQASFHSLLFDAFRKQTEVLEVVNVKHPLLSILEKTLGGRPKAPGASWAILPILRVLDDAFGAPCEAEVPGPWVRRPTAGHSIAANNIAAYDVPRRCPT